MNAKIIIIVIIEMRNEGPHWYKMYVLNLRSKIVLLDTIATLMTASPHH